jgi:5'-nucleotidase
MPTPLRKIWRNLRVTSLTTNSPDWNTIDFAILDMDGTLLDLHFDNQVWNDLLPRLYGEKHSIDEFSAREQISARMNDVRGTLPWYCIDYWTRTLDIEINSLEAELKSLICMRPGAQAFLEYLAAFEVRLILATNAHPKSLERKLQRTGIGTYFADIVSAHFLGVAKESMAFWHGLERRCGLVAERTIVIDDNHEVLRTARDYGIARVYGISRPDSHKAPVTASDYPCLDTFSELLGPTVTELSDNTDLSSTA